MAESLTLAPTGNPHVFVAPDGRRMTPPSDWACLPPGDAGLTRRVKAAGPSWQVIEKKGRKAFSRGLWAPAANIERARTEVTAERSTEQYAKKRATDVARRERGQVAYAVSFEAEVHTFLRFAQPWQPLARSVARLVAAHATPVGSGTVARTERIPLEERAQAAVIAWMRHQTTGYDDMRIERVAGRRREVRRELAQVSRAVLDLHRNPAPHAPRACPLCTAVATAEASEGAARAVSPTGGADTRAASANHTDSRGANNADTRASSSDMRGAIAPTDDDDSYLDALDL